MSGSPASRAAKWAAIVLGGLIGLVVVLAAIASLVNLAGPISGIASRATGLDVKIRQSARLNLFTLTPHLEIKGLEIANPEWVAQQKNGAPRDMADIPFLSVSALLGPLFGGDLVLQRIEIDDPKVFLLREKDGKANWTVGNPNEPKKSKPSKLPAIKSFALRGGQIRIIDQKYKLDFDGTVNSTDKPPSQNQLPFRFAGTGSLNDRPFKLDMTGSSLVNVEPDKPYTLSARLDAGQTHLQADVTVPHPFQLGDVSGTLSMKGDDLADLYYVTGIAMPNTPPYEVRSQISRKGNRYELSGFSGSIGSSDVSGDIRADLSGGKPVMDVVLHSRTLDFRDLGALLGTRLAGAHAAPATKDKAANGKLLLPNAPLDLQRVRTTNAKLDYSADAVRLSQAVDLKQVKVGLTLQDGDLKIAPLRVDFPQGDLAGTVEIDARQAVPTTKLDLKLTNIELQNLIKSGSGPRPIEGAMEGRIRLEGTGLSVHEAAAHSAGQIAFVIPSGEIRKAFAELLGIDVARGLSLILSKDQQKTALRCGAMDFDVQNGLAAAKTFVIDTDAVRVTGSGSVNFGDEALDLSLQGHPKHVSLRIRAPISIGGTLSAPSIGIKPGQTLAQAGIAGALGALLTPLGSILAFIDPGLAGNADCGRLINEARSEGAPVPENRRH